MRHWMYEHVFGAVRPWAQAREPSLGPVSVLEYGSLEPTTPVIRMLKYLLGADRVDAHVTPEYPNPLGDVCIPSQPSECADVLVLDQVLEHTETPWIVPANLYRMLRPGGLAVVTTPFMFPLHYCPIDGWRFTPQTYRRLFGPDQWETLACAGWGGEAQLRWYLQDNHMLNFIAVGDAKQAIPDWDSPNFDTNYPMVVWWVGQKH